MKAAIAFLFAALSCIIGSGNALLPGLGLGGSKKGGAVPSIPKECLEKLLKVDVPQTLEKLQHMLCLYTEGKKTNNEELYKAFLRKLHDTLKDAGCTVDELLNIMECLETVTDKVGEVADKAVCEILKLAEGLGVLGTVLNIVCGVLGGTLETLSKTLAGFNLDLNLGVLGLLQG